MNPAWQAHCDCGALSIGLHTAPVTQLVCHCADCRTITGQPCTAIAFFPPDSFEVRGRRDSRTLQGGSGISKTYFLCADCGRCVYAQVGALDGAVAVDAQRITGFRFRPQFHIFAAQKSAGTRIPALAVRFRGGTPTLMRLALRTYLRLRSRLGPA